MTQTAAERGAAGPEPRRRKGLGRTAARGAAYLGLSQIIRLAITMISTVAVARVLRPDDFGVIAMTAPITGFILLFQNLGLNQALIQARTISDEQMNALFFYNMLASAAIAAILLLVSPLVGLFYGDERASYITAASAITVLLTGSTLQHTALINRNMRFRALGFVEVAVAATNLVAAFCFALWLRNYWAIWLGTLCGVLVNVVLVWSLSPWRPSRHVAWGSARHMITFGAHLTGFNLLNFLSRNLDNVLIAKFWGPAAVGLYDRSYKLMLFPLRTLNTPLGRIMLPALSRVQDDPARFRRMFLLALRALSIVSIPGIIAAAICSDRLVPFLLGDHWSAAGPIFFWLSLAGIAQPASNATGWLFISTGRTREMFRWGLVGTPTTILSFFIGLPWGGVGVAAAIFFGQMLRIPILYAWSTRDTPVRARDLYAAMAPTLVGGALAWISVEWLRHVLPTAAFILIAFVLSYGFTLVVQSATLQGRLALGEMIRLGLSVVRRRASNG